MTFSPTLRKCLPNSKIIDSISAVLKFLRIEADILSSAKGRFSLLLRFRLHSSRSGRFCKNPLPSSKVAADYSIASLRVSVPCLAGAQGRSQPLTEDFIEAIAIMPFFRTYPMDLLLFFHLMKQYIRFAIHLLSKDRSFLAQMIVIPH